MIRPTQDNLVFPRILIVTNMYPSDRDPAYGVFVEDSVRALSALGASVEVLFLDGRDSALEYLWGIRRIRRRVQAGAFDLVHAHYGLTGFCSSFQPLPLVVTFHGDDLLGTPSRRPGGITLKSQLIRFLSRIAARRAQSLICVSGQLQSTLPRARDQRRAVVIPGGIDVERFSPGDRLAARQRLGIRLDERLVLFPSTPSERRKRIDLATAAVDEAAASGRPIRLLTVSGVPNAGMPDYYRAADCLLLTSDWEGSPTVVKEALCCDLPVVAVDAGDAWKWMQLVSGCQAVGRDIPSISGGIERVLASARRVDGGSVRRLLSWQQIGKELIAVYRKACVQETA
jgi:glycosyltransferase involved in cell wall biosynthesis